MSEKYFGADNLTDNYRQHLRASVEGEMRYMRRDVMMLLVAGMEDSRINITSTMRLARVSRLIKYLENDLQSPFQELTDNNIIFQQQVNSSFLCSYTFKMGCSSLIFYSPIFQVLLQSANLHNS